MAVIYHPETQGTVVVPDEALSHYRQSGWVTVDEWQEHLRLRDLTEANARAVRDAAARNEVAEDAPVRLPRKTVLDKETK
jgi:hypothetical protein